MPIDTNCPVTDPSLVPFAPESANYDIIQKFKDIMVAATSEGSVYLTGKDTIEDQFNKLDLTPEAKAQLMAQTVITLMQTVTSSAMATAKQWAKDEIEGQYDLAIKKIQAQQSVIDFHIKEKELCIKDAQLQLLASQQELVEKQIELAQANKCHINAQAHMVAASNIRENGTSAWNLDTCSVGSLADEGVRWTEMQLTQSKKDMVDKETKAKYGADGTGGTEGARLAFINRQTAGFADNALKDIIAASAQMIGIAIGSETPVDFQCERDLWQNSVRALYENAQGTPPPACP